MSSRKKGTRNHPCAFIDAPACLAQDDCGEMPVVSSSR